MNISANKEEISFEQALNELETIVKGLESGSSDLEKAIKDYEKGNKLIKICEKKLNDAKLRVEKIIKNEDGNYTTTKFDSE
jgi:exodeoxyribonuclease VII small subunit